MMPQGRKLVRIHKLLIVLGITASLFVVSIFVYERLEANRRWNEIIEDAEERRAETIKRHEALQTKLQNKHGDGDTKKPTAESD